MRYAAAAMLLAATSASAAELRIQDSNASGQGFDDTTPTTPVGLNFGTTRGAQAVIAFQYAAAIWGATLKSAVPIRIDAAFVTTAQDSDMTCNATSGLLGFARPVSFGTSSSFPNPQAGYVAALANALAGQDLTPDQAHIKTRFNAGIGTKGCLPQISWYYGLDGTAPPGQVSLLATLLHEFAHGLGFSSFVDPSSGGLSGPPSIFDFHVYDEVGQSNWAGYAAAKRAPLLVRGNELAFDGVNVTANIGSFLEHAPVLNFTGNGVTTQAGFQPGQFSSAIPDAGPQAIAVATPLDACADLLPGSMLGVLGLVQRGNCNFYDKAQRAAAAGASGVIIYDNDAGPLITMASPDGGVPLEVPAVFITNQDGTDVLQRLDGGTVTALFASSDHISNTDTAQQRVLLYTPSAISAGSTLSHWNGGSFPKSLLMEPFLGSTARVNLDLTPAALADLGWPVVNGLSVGMSKAQSATLESGGQATYLISVLNRRTTAMDGVGLDLTLPAGAKVVSASGGCTALPCDLGSVAAGEVRPVVVTVQAPPSTVFPFEVTAALTAPAADTTDNLTATIAAGKAAPRLGGGCSAGGVPSALVVLLVAAAGIRARRKGQRSSGI
jgi:uncharacterized protein (TIGR03382 family)